MKRHSPVILALLGLAACAAGRQHPATTAVVTTCASEIDAAQLTLGYGAFDAAGWRDQLAAGCVDSAVTQLEAYRAANTARLNPTQIRELHFHVGQAYAFSGREPESVPHFVAARGGDDEWSAYVDATLAFLRRDAAALGEARALYAAAPNPDAMRLSVIDGFLACPEAAYMEAAHCAMAH